MKILFFVIVTAAFVYILGFSLCRMAKEDKSLYGNIKKNKKLKSK